MGLIQDWLRKRKEQKYEENAYAREQQAIDSYNQKRLSANERELLRFKEEDRKKRIKAELERYRKRDNDRVWRGKQGNPIYAQNIVKDQKNLFNGGSMFSNVPNVANQPNIISHTKNVVNTKNVTKGGKNLFKNGKKLFK